jgi:hypothetical protein
MKIRYFEKVSTRTETIRQLKLERSLYLTQHTAFPPIGEPVKFSDNGEGFIEMLETLGFRYDPTKEYVGYEDPWL